jgi:hypothetical protein
VRLDAARLVRVHTEICDLGHGQGGSISENMIRKARPAA